MNVVIARPAPTGTFWLNAQKYSMCFEMVPNLFRRFEIPLEHIMDTWKGVEIFRSYIRGPMSKYHWSQDVWTPPGLFKRKESKFSINFNLNFEGFLGKKIRDFTHPSFFSFEML